MKKRNNDKLLHELHEAVEPAYDPKGQEITPKRKDMVGSPAVVDRHATMALLKNAIRKPRNNGDSKSKSVLEEFGLELDKNPNTKQHCTA